jgi:hypothetical protein
LASVSPPGALLPTSEKNRQIVILFNALFTIFLLRAMMRVKVTGNCDRIYKKRFFILYIFVSSQYWQ